MEFDDLKSLLDAQQDAFLKALDARDEAINARLKAIEEMPATKSTPFITQDGGAKDPEIKNFADFLKAVQRKDHTRLASVYSTGWQDGGLKALGEASGPTGGFLVPVEYADRISKIEATIAFFEALAFQVPMTTEIVKVPTYKQTANPTTSGQGASGYYAGAYVNLESEGGTIDNRQPEFEMMELRARKLTGLTVSSNELRSDAPQVENEIMTLFAQAMAAAKQSLYLHYNGVGGPLGALNAANPARMTVTRKASGNNIEIQDVTGLMSRMIPSLSGNAIFIAHPYALEDLMQLSLVTNGDPAFIPANGAPGSPLMGTLVGKPVYANEYMAPPGTAGDLAYVAPQAYAVGTRSGLLIQGSEHAYFTTDQYAWRFTTRIDGRPRLDGTVKLADGSNSQVSAFVVLN